MARKINEIENSIQDKLTNLGFSKSNAAEWKTWTHCFAYVIYTFELILDSFRKEMDKKAEGMHTGSLAWYNEMCFRFQMDDALLFDNRTARVYYEKEDEQKKIIKAAAVTVNGQELLFRVAKTTDNVLKELDSAELTQFAAYLDMIKFAGTQTTLISEKPDSVTYRITIYFDPAFVSDTLPAAIIASLDAYKAEQKFGGVIYRHKVLEAVTCVPGVTTASVDSLKYRTSHSDATREVETFAELHAGNFEFDHENSIIEVKNSLAPNITKIIKL